MSFAYEMEKYYIPGLDPAEQIDCIEEAFGGEYAETQWAEHGFDDDGSEKCTNKQMEIILRQCKEGEANPEIIKMVESWMTEGF